MIPPPPPPPVAARQDPLRAAIHATRWSAARGLLLMGGLIVLAFVLRIDAGGEVTLLGQAGPGCIVRRLCGDGICPGCGLTRSTVLAAARQWGASWSAHPLGMLTLCYALAGAGLHLVALLRGCRHALELKILRFGTRSYAFALILVASWRLFG